ncbi:ribosome recycling factor, putative [Talaromyces stipitatus ATCC 10500]|uniref:Ribosome recycling factor, putative n=1 Tax=Talaromyces stipitatus (strain ATCC 10500 / CBS 375.48 / QM 6759 / NRRL 1006) TaxID=441959 RepID=B8MHN0_TALSN|nr:ribosome recycling factor domain-containing protein [Talaromyces stipitatus ATCC 10500]EED16011.1 ribosome recycling factor, putative [Talaromyces stipitatus ATCC 10500]
MPLATRRYFSTAAKTSKCLTHSIFTVNRPQYSIVLNQNVSRYQTPSSSNRSAITLTHLQRHTFTNSASLSKKKDKNKRNDDVDSSQSTSAAAGAGGGPDPFNFSQLQTGISDALTRLKEDLQKLRSGGRFNPEVIEQLRVNLVKGSNETVRLSEVAQVVPKGGRAVTIIVGEEDLVKPVNSAIISSNLSLTPQPDAHNPLQLNVPIPPPTKESRDQAIKAAKGAMDKAANAVRSARASVHKRLQDMQKKKEARPDDIRKAHDQMEKLVEKAQKDVKDTFESARKGMEQV